MKKISKILIIITVFAVLYSCKDEFLEVKPKGSLDVGVLATADGVDALLIGAYSLLDGTANMGFGWEAASSNWVFGSIRGMEGNKGTDSGDQPDINPIQTFSEAATNPYINIKWRSAYEAISRTNAVIQVTVQALADGTIDQATADSFTKQARVLRGWFHFEAWRMWEMVPYVDETTDQTTLTNTSDIRANIIADLTEGTTLPNDMVQIGRFNGTVSKVLLAKAQMQMMGDYAAAKTLLQDVVNTGTKPDGSPIGLAPTYGEIFNIGDRNGIESVYTIQYSVNDGSGGWNGGWGEVLNFPYKANGGSPGECCGFHQATQEFINSFRTSGGLPMLPGQYNDALADLRDQGISAGPLWEDTNADPTVIDDYEKDQWVTVRDPAAPFLDRAYVALTGTAAAPNNGNNPLTSPADWDLKWVEDNSLAVDPRLDVSVGRRGIPYLDWGIHTGQDWIRDQTYAGPFSPKKQVYQLSDLGSTTETGNWTSGYTANGYRMIRYADVLLMLAEAQIETADLASALANINLVRARAANAAGFVKEDDGTTDAANYQISLYTLANFGNGVDALRMERKLELGMEGHRWFDLNRWGNTVTELNRVLTYEKTMPWASLMYGSATVGAEDVTYPIPSRQIDLANGGLTQNR